MSMAGIDPCPQSPRPCDKTTAGSLCRPSPAVKTRSLRARHGHRSEHPCTFQRRNRRTCDRAQRLCRCTCAQQGRRNLLGKGGTRDMQRQPTQCPLPHAGDRSCEGNRCIPPSLQWRRICRCHRPSSSCPPEAQCRYNPRWDQRESRRGTNGRLRNSFLALAIQTNESGRTDKPCTTAAGPSMLR